jgi:hypothetical protein
MSDQIEELIKEIAGKHGIAVGRDDPILILRTINARLMEDNIKIQQTMLEQYKSELEELNLRWSNDAKEKAEKILTVALNASSESMKNLMEEGTTKTAESIRSEVDKAASVLASKITDAKTVANLNIVASSLTIIAAATVLWSVLK